MDSPAAPTTANPKKNNTNPSSRTSPSGNKNKRSRHQRGKNNNNNNNNNKNKENGKGHKCGSGGRGNPRRKNSSSNNNNHRPMSQEKISRALSWALRHAALNIGLSIREDGFVPVQEILDSTHPKLRGATLENIKLVVNNNDKQRFKLEERPRRLYYESKSKTNTSQRDPTDTTTNASATEETATEPEPEPETILCIRANQGHSMDLINPELLLTKLSPQDLRSLPCIVHGTYPKAWESIHRAPEHGGGLRTMNRTHIHFASGLPAESGVISGMRKSCSVHVYVDASLCAADDRIEFFRSDNGVILTDGVGDSGVLPIEYFSHVTDSSGKILLDNRKNNNPVR